jgi:hypothetical protein
MDQGCRWRRQPTMTAKPKDIDRLYGLEPVFEPGEEAGSDALERFVEVECPYCAETITTRVDLSAGPQSYVEDCQVCCQPIAIALLLTDAGELREVSVERLGQ